MSYFGKKVSAIIVAAGMGKRMNSSISKQFIFIGNKPILAYTLERFNNLEYIDEIVVVAKEEEVQYCKEEIIEKYDINKVTSIVAGGKERQDSVYSGLKALSEDSYIVTIQDGVRPFTRVEDILESIEKAHEFNGCVVGVPVKDTIKVVNHEGFIQETPDRAKLWAVQTPQTFKYSIIVKAYELAMKESYYATDDSLLVERIGYNVLMVKGSYENIKITTPEDLIFARGIIDKEKE